VPMIATPICFIDFPFSSGAGRGARALPPIIA